VHLVSFITKKATTALKLQTTAQSGRR